MGMDIDYALPGLAGIRLIDATPDDAAVVTRQLGIPPSPAGLEPDISIRFVDSLPLSSPLRLLGAGDAGFTDDAFLVLRGRHKSRARVEVPFARIGRRPEIVCERGLLQVPLLIPILNLTVLGRGALPLHASAFTYRGTGFVATGWSKGGKTEALLAFMARGAEYVADEWVYLSEDGLRMQGIPQPIRIWSWHLDSLPRYRKALGAGDRARLHLLGPVVKCIDRLLDGRSPRRAWVRTAGRWRALLGGQLHADVAPHRLFGREACAMSGTPDKLLLLIGQEAQEVDVRPVDPEEVARRMASSLEEEQAVLVSYYRKHRFAFPEAANELIEDSSRLQREALVRTLRGKDSYVVLHPHRVPLPSLFEAIEKRCLEG